MLSAFGVHFQFQKKFVVIYFSITLNLNLNVIGLAFKFQTDHLCLHCLIMNCSFLGMFVA